MPQLLCPLFPILALLAAPGVLPGEPPGEPPDGLPALDWVEKRVAELQPTARDRRLDEIGWAGSLLEAERLSRESGRPVFLFTLDGKMGIGRC